LLIVSKGNKEGKLRGVGQPPHHTPESHILMTSLFTSEGKLPKFKTKTTSPTLSVAPVASLHHRGFLHLELALSPLVETSPPLSQVLQKANAELVIIAKNIKLATKAPLGERGNGIAVKSDDG